MSFHIHGFVTRYSPGDDGEMKAVDWVTYSPIGKASFSKTSARVTDMLNVQPLLDHSDNSAIIMAHDRKNVIEPAYKAWKEGNEVPLDGTPLGAWPALSPEQAESIRSLGIRTVEEIRDASDSILTRLPITNARKMSEQATLFLKNIDKAALADNLKNKDDEIAALKDQMREMQSMIVEQDNATAPRKSKAKAAA